MAIVMPDPVERLEAHQIEDCLIDAVMDYDAAHGTYTLCIVWPQRDKALAGIH